MPQRIVIKIGSSSLTMEKGGLNKEKIAYFANELMSIQQLGFQVLLVSSGAVAAGFLKMGYTKRPSHINEKQAAAAVGQALLMQFYQEAFAFHDQGVAQILLTRSDFSNRKKIHNALSTIEELLAHQIIPIINENDTVAIDELKFGDNDTLSALVANLVRADRLVIITDTDGLYTGDPRKINTATKIEKVHQFSDDLFRLAGGSGSDVGTGGMRSKLEAARIAVRGGVPVFIGKAIEKGDISAAITGDGKGTYFESSLQNLSTKKQWIGFHSSVQGKVTVDQGAEQAILFEGKSLLPAGIIQVSSDFHPGDVIEVININNKVIGKGVVNYAAWQLRAVAGLSSKEVKKRVEVQRLEVIHRDEWTSLK